MQTLCMHACRRPSTNASITALRNRLPANGVEVADETYSGSQDKQRRKRATGKRSFSVRCDHPDNVVIQNTVC